MGQNIIPSDSVGFFEALQKLSTNQQQLALVRPNNPPAGIAGFLFNIVGDEDIELRSDITDHFTEANTPVQDNIALLPEIVTVRGIVAELAQVAPVSPAIAPLEDTLLPNPNMVPQLTPGAAQTAVLSAETKTRQDAALTDGQSLYGVYERTFGQNPDQTRQTNAFLYFYSLWQSRELFTVETPWGFFTNMAIEVFRSEQPEDTKYKTDFTITFKKIRIAQSVTVNLGQLAGRLQSSQSPLSQNGNAGLAEPSTNERASLLYKWTHPDG